MVTGTTVIDALLHDLDSKYEFRDHAVRRAIARKNETRGRIILITMHRRESWSDAIKNTAEVVRELSARYPETTFLFPIHRNPIVRESVYPILSALHNVYLIEP